MCNLLSPVDDFSRYNSEVERASLTIKPAAGWSPSSPHRGVVNRVIRRVLVATGSLRLPWQLRLLQRFPGLRRIPARLIGLGVRPEHVRTPDAFSRLGGA